MLYTTLPKFYPKLIGPISGAQEVELVLQRQQNTCGQLYSHELTVDISQDICAQSQKVERGHQLLQLPVS